LGPLATYAEPHCYDLCAEHSERLTAPRGWEVVRLLDGSAPAQPSGDDLEALANAVREAARPQERAAGAGGGAQPADPGEVARRGRLRLLRSPDNRRAAPRTVRPGACHFRTPWVGVRTLPVVCGGSERTRVTSGKAGRGC